MDGNLKNLQDLNEKLKSLLIKDIIQMQQKRFLMLLSVKKSCHLEITKSILNFYLLSLSERPENAILNTTDEIRQSINQFDQEIRGLKLYQFSDYYPFYSKMRLKTTNAELKAFEYWLNMIIRLQQCGGHYHDK